MTKLTEIRLSHLDKRNRQYWLYKCECGNEKVIHKAAVTSGNTKSCGCLLKEAGKRRLLPNNQGHIGVLYTQYKRHAKDRNLDFNITREEFTELINKPCTYCRDEGSNTHTHKPGNKFKYNGVDRIDSNLGYSTQNTVPCCKTCNIAKNTMTQEEFYRWIERVYKSMAEQWSNLI